MTTTTMRRGLRAGFVVAVFTTGYVCGTTFQQPAQAQVGEMGTDMIKKAAEGGGPLGQAAELGTTISSMEESVSNLQKNIEVLNKIKAALGG